MPNQLSFNKRHIDARISKLETRGQYNVLVYDFVCALAESEIHVDEIQCLAKTLADYDTDNLK